MANLSYSAAEIDERLGKTDDIGDLTELETTDKSSVVDAINELFTSVSDGKTAIAAAITDKGVPTAATDSFADMADNIGDIPSPSLQSSRAYTVSASGSQTISPGTGYDAMEAVALTVPAGAAKPASTISATGASVSTGTNTLTLSKTVSNTPQVVSTGFVTAGTSGDSSVSLTASVTTKVAATIHPSTSDQSIASGTYLTGAQTVKAVTHNLSPGDIKSGVTLKIGDSSDDDCVASVTGTYAGKNVQIAAGVNRATTSTLAAVSGQSITVAKSGTYNVYWGGFRSSTSGTSGSQLYKNNAAYGTENTTFTNHGQSVHLSNVSLNQGDVIQVYARSRGSNYYMYVSNLTIIEA